jgi:ABC-type polysaccharide/polyol phosphate transport system ATPase subunit
MVSVNDVGLASGSAGAGAQPRSMVVVDDAHVTYRVYASGKKLSARENALSFDVLRGGRGLTTVPALRGVSFTACEGESIGVVGHNGSGKSTLFRAISGLIPTSSGTILARERPVLLGVNAALMPELSGENNIKLGLLAMGFSPEEAAARVGEIADFAELNEFIYHPMRTYSSGMGARLRFAIASAKAHSILLVDEALAVGDRRFRQKSEQRIRELRSGAGLVMIVSHSVGSIKDTCERALWIHKGELRADGASSDVVDEYMRWTKQPGGAVGAAAVARRNARARAARRLAATSPADDEKTGAGRPPAEHAAAGSFATAAITSDAAPAVGLASSPDLAVQESVLLSRAVQTTDPRSLARRERYRRAGDARIRKRILVSVVACGALLLAVGAGAAMAFITAVPPAAEKAERATVTRAPVDAVLNPASVTGFSASAPSVACATAEGEAAVALSWEVKDAARIAIAIGPQQVDALDAPLVADLPATASGHAVPFPCTEEARAYTLTVEGIDGDRVSSVVTVARSLPPEPEPSQRSGVDRGTTNPGTTDPAPDPGAGEPAPVDPAPTEPAPEPTMPPEETPPPEPEIIPDPIESILP